MDYTFKGGKRIDEFKNTRNSAIENLPAPEYVTIPMLQHEGALPCEPIVSVGEYVYLGQKIGDYFDEPGCFVHSSVSGLVDAITSSVTDDGIEYKIIVIKNDMQNIVDPSVQPFAKKLSDTNTDEIIGIIKEAGIAGLGGGAFPTHLKIHEAVGKVDRIIVNCAESEPFLSANHRLLLEDPASVINGIKIIMKALDVRSSYIAVDENKFDAIKKLRDITKQSKLISVKVLRTKYPQGDERLLLKALTRREIREGKRSSDLGYLILNPETCSAVFKAFASGLPLVRRIVTVDGDIIENPKNVLVPIGTPVSELLDFCGVKDCQKYTVIMGGPMSGKSIPDLSMPVTKKTTGIIALSEGWLPGKTKAEPVCIRCARCVSVCPMRLMPLYLSMYSKKGDTAAAKRHGALTCTGCGLCSYVCPGKLELTEHIKEIKAQIKK